MPELASGKTLSHYRILEKLGQGGMGVVWKAEDQVLGRPVAIKVLPPEAARDDGRCRMFLDEARLASSLNQANIAQVYEFSSEGDLRFIVMEYVEGEPLSRKIRHRPLQSDFISDIGHQVAKALAKAHRKGLLHRDLKPSNILVTPDGEAKVVDFGLATLFTEPDGSATGLSSVSRVETRSYDGNGDGHGGARQIVGTLPYMSPEQVRGGKLDARSDIFSFGAILYEMTTGQRPFAGATSSEVATEIQNARPRRIHEIHPKVPIELERIIHKALAARPSERYQTMEDMSVDLMRLGKDLESGSSPSYEEALGSSGAVEVSGWNPAAWTPRGRLLGLFAALAVVAAVAGWMVLKPPTGTSEAAPAAGPGQAVDASMTGRVRQLTFTGKSVIPLWSPDGRSIAFFSGGTERGTYLIPVEGGTPRQLSLAETTGMAWNWAPDGRSLLTHGRHPEKPVGAVYQVDIFGDPEKLLAESAQFPDLHRDGRRLAFALRWPDEQGIWVKDLETGEQHQVTGAHGEGTAAYKPQWSPVDDRIAYHRWEGFGHELWVFDPSDGSDMRVMTDPIEASGHFDWTPDGKALVVGGELGGVFSIWKFSLDGSRPVRLTPGSEEELHTSVAPDGSGVAFQRARDISRLSVLEIASGSTTEPLTMSVAAKNATFSADGESLVFQTLINGQWQVWSASLGEGSAPHAIVQSKGTSSFRPATGENGKIYHVRSDVNPASVFGKIGWTQSLWSSDLSGGLHSRIRGAGDRVSQLAPTPVRGGRILFLSYGETSGESVQILEGQGPPITVMESSKEEPVQYIDWGTGDDEVLVMTSGVQGDHLFSMDIESGDRREIFSTGSLNLGEPDGDLRSAGTMALSPDRSQLAVVARGSEAAHAGLYLMDMQTLAFERLRYFEGLAHPDFIAWSPDGRKLVMDLHQNQADIFVLEGLGDTLVERPAS